MGIRGMFAVQRYYNWENEKDKLIKYYINILT
jgi:hypothetical protein